MGWSSLNQKDIILLHAFELQIPPLQGHLLKVLFDGLSNRLIYFYLKSIIKLSLVQDDSITY